MFRIFLVDYVYYINMFTVEVFMDTALYIPSLGDQTFQTSKPLIVYTLFVIVTVNDTRL